jgi:hypothetical protein
MALFGPRPLPLTSYGYQPPRGATAKGWSCTNREDCGTSDFVPPQRWPVRCPQCGWPCDPMFNEPWEHDARGVELNWSIRNERSEYSRLYASEQLLAWQVKDALLRRDAGGAATARDAMRDYVDRQVRAGAHWTSGFTLSPAVRAELEADDLDGAADDLCFWLERATGEGAEEHNDIRTNARTVISAGAQFLAAPGGAAHPRAPEIRKGCLRVAEGCYNDLSAGLQDAITQMTMGDALPVPTRGGAADLPAQQARRGAQDRISSERLADFGRYLFLGSKLNAGGQQDSLSWVRALAEPIWMSAPNARVSASAELRRHAARGEWEAVGAWKFVREFLDEAPDTQGLIDGGLLAIAKMRVTNLGFNLAPVDVPRYRELTGLPVQNDGFFGPPVFDSAYGPNRQFYFDSAIAAAARRSPARLPHAPGVAPGPVTDAARAMWDFGQLIYRGPLVVNPDTAFEPNVVRHAVEAARGVDHARFTDRVADAIADPANHLAEGYAPIGAARFAEDYLAPEAMRAPGYDRLLDTGLSWLARHGDPGLMVAPDLLTPVQRDRLARLRSGTR